MKKKIINNFSKQGYCIITLFTTNDINKIKTSIIDKINFLIKNTGKKIKKNELKFYHRLKHLDKIHPLAIKSSTRYISLDNKMRNKISLNKDILKIINLFWGHSKFNIKWVGSLKKNTSKSNKMAFRIARPQYNFKYDVGGEHLDLHYGGIIRENNYKSTLTIWCPIIGHTKKYTLRLSPRSHLKKHPVNFVSKQKSYVTRAFKKGYLKNFKFIRPNLKPGQVILFHPNTIHGGSINYGNQTRVSAELRIFNKRIINI